MEPVASHGREATASDGVAGPWLLVVCSLEPWGMVQRRMQLMVRELMDLDPTVSVVFVEPAVDVPYALAHGDVTGAFRKPGASSERRPSCVPGNGCPGCSARSPTGPWPARSAGPFAGWASATPCCGSTTRCTPSLVGTTAGRRSTT